MTTRKNAQNLVDHASQQLKNIQAEYDKSLTAMEVSPSLKIEIKNFCENLRSALDYVARSIHREYCTSGKNGEEIPKIYFPYATLQNTQDIFIKTLRKKFVGLEQARCDIFDQLIQVQHFGKKNYTWLPSFVKLTNENKHEHLVPQIRIEHKALQISGPAVIHGGQTVSIDNLPNMTGGKAKIISWSSFNFETDNLPVLPLLANAHAGVQEIINTINDLMAKNCMPP